MGSDTSGLTSGCRSFLPPWPQTKNAGRVDLEVNTNTSIDFFRVAAVLPMTAALQVKNALHRCPVFAAVLVTATGDIRPGGDDGSRMMVHLAPHDVGDPACSDEMRKNEPYRLEYDPASLAMTHEGHMFLSVTGTLLTRWAVGTRHLERIVMCHPIGRQWAETMRVCVHNGYIKERMHKGGLREH